MCAVLHDAFLQAINTVLQPNQLLTHLYKDILGAPAVACSLQLNV